LSEKSVRVQRVERELHHLVALFLQHELGEPLPALVSVTAVDVTGDLRKAVVYFRLVGEDSEVKESEKVLEENRRRVQKKVAEEIALKFTPVLEFRFGRAKPDEQTEIDRMLADLHQGKRRWE
jgi:ribosome-binding factor A